MMSMLAKVRRLVGALVHKPFMPKSEKIDLDEGQALASGETRQASSLSAASTGDLPDQERVADLISRQQRDAS